MNVEEMIRTQLHETSIHIPLKPIRIDVVLRDAHRAQRRHRAMVAVAVAASLAVAVIAGRAVWPDGARLGERLTPPTGPGESALSEATAHDVVNRFVRLLRADDAPGSRDMLTPAARERTGDLEKWREAIGPLEAQIGWIASEEIDARVTALSTSSGRRHVAVFTAPARDGQALLEPLVLEVVGGEPLIDLASPRLAQDVSLEPEAPQFFACTPGCDPSDMWPEVHDGMTFSVVLGPGDEVADAWFAVDGNAWVARASFTPAEDGLVRAQATFDADDVGEGTKVFLVAIETRDGVLETYGYRVNV